MPVGVNNMRCLVLDRVGPTAQVVAVCSIHERMVGGIIASLPWFGFAPCSHCGQHTHVYVQEFSEWSQCHVLELTSFYTPSSEAEVYDILNVLEDRLNSPSSAVVLAAIKVFLHHTINMTATHQQVSAGGGSSRVAEAHMFCPCVAEFALQPRRFRIGQGVLLQTDKFDVLIWRLALKVSGPHPAAARSPHALENMLVFLELQARAFKSTFI